MLDSLVKGPLGDFLKEKTGLTGEQTDKASSVTTETVKNDLKDEAVKGNFNGIQKLMSGSATDSPVYSRLSSSVVSNLVSKVGIDKGMATQIADMAIPFIMGKISGKTGGKADAGVLDNILGGGIKEKLGNLGGFFK